MINMDQTGQIRGNTVSLRLAISSSIWRWSFLSKNNMGGERSTTPTEETWQQTQTRLTVALLTTLGLLNRTVSVDRRLHPWSSHFADRVTASIGWGATVLHSTLPTDKVTFFRACVWLWAVLLSFKRPSTFEKTHRWPFATSSSYSCCPCQWLESRLVRVIDIHRFNKQKNKQK